MSEIILCGFESTLIFYKHLKNTSEKYKNLKVRKLFKCLWISSTSLKLFTDYKISLSLLLLSSSQGPLHRHPRVRQHRFTSCCSKGTILVGHYEIFKQKSFWKGLWLSYLKKGAEKEFSLDYILWRRMNKSRLGLQKSSSTGADLEDTEVVMGLTSLLPSQDMEMFNHSFGQ